MGLGPPKHYFINKSKSLWSCCPREFNKWESKYPTHHGFLTFGAKHKVDLKLPHAPPYFICFPSLMHACMGLPHALVIISPVFYYNTIARFLGPR